MEIEQKARESIVSIRSLANLVRKHGPSPSFADSLEKIADHLESALRAKGQEETPPLNEPFGNSEQLAEPVSTAYTLPEARRWPFVESPGEFTERLARAMQEFPLLGAVRHVLIENPPALAQQPAAPSGEAVAWMDPNTLDVVHVQRKEAWMDSFGAGGKAKAAMYTMPLYAAPVGVEGRLCALADELMSASEQEDTPSASIAFADASGRVRTLAEALSRQPAATSGEAEGLLADLETIWHSVSDDKETNAAYQRLKAVLSQQPAGVDEAFLTNGTRVEWQDNFGRWWPATITGWHPATYDARLDDGCDANGYARGRFRALASSPPSAPVPPNAVVWHPIETAPKDNKRPLYLAQFNTETGDLIDLDWDASWEPESESWEIPQVYYIWRSANGRVEEPTHWAYQDLQQPAAPSGDAASAEPAVWVAADTLNSPHPTCISSLAYMSQLDRERGREYVPLYAAPQQPAGVDEAMVERALAAYLRRQDEGESLYGCVTAALTAALAAQQQGIGGRHG